MPQLTLLLLITYTESIDLIYTNTVIHTRHTQTLIDLGLTPDAIEARLARATQRAIARAAAERVQTRTRRADVDQRLAVLARIAELAEASVVANHLLHAEAVVLTRPGGALVNVDFARRAAPARLANALEPVVVKSHVR